MASGTQLAAMFEDAAIAQLDELVATGRFASRAEAVRAAVHAYLDVERRRAAGQAIVDGYLRVPETNAEMATAEDNLRRLIAEEPW